MRIKKQWIFLTFLIFIMLIINIVLPKWNRGKTYNATQLPSEFCTGNETRIVDNLDQTGCLTFGPYINQEAGKIQVTILYETNGVENWVDIYSDSLKKTFQKAKLDPTKKKIILEAEIDTNITDLEIRNHYEKSGYLRVEKIIIKERVKDLQIMIGIYNLLFLAGIIGWYVKSRINSFQRKE